MAPPHFLPETDPLDPRHAFDRRANWVRMRTLVLLRWIAIAGQIVAVIVGRTAFSLEFEIGLIYATIGAAIITNLMAALIYPQNKRLSETELLAALILDMVQLSLLLALTGGLNNPFALLILAQVAISATALGRNSTILVCAMAVILITTLWFFHLPMIDTQGRILQLPPLFLTGFWAAIVIGIVFQAAYARRVISEVTIMSDALAATQMALAREQKLTDLGGVVAAAAHELGTPLSTIALVAGEMIDEAETDLLREDAVLIRRQADRCREILRDMGRAGNQDRQIRVAPISSVIEEAAEPHRDRGIDLVFDCRAEAGSDAKQPIIERRPEIVHGARNLIQNAVDFAQARVWVDIRWSDTAVALRISDDGPGFPPEALPILGDPFLRHRKDGANPDNRRGYEGLGLGLFIAKTLLERSGAEITFANARDGFGHAIPDTARSGAIASAMWQRATIAVAADRKPLGRNTPTD